MARGDGPLGGMKVLDLTHVMAGPTCALMLSDMGADVIKVEKVPGGDDTRRAAPPKIGDEAAAFLVMNRGKRSIAVDLKTEGGKDVVRRLAREADVLLENYRRGTLAKLGLAYEDLRKDNPKLVWCSISGFGQTGPYAERGGFDLIAQGMSGLMHITGEGPGRPPCKVGAPITDITAGILAAMGVSAAYAHALKTGQGQVVDTSLFEAGIIHTYWQSAIAFATGVSPAAMGSAHPLNAPYQAFETADGWITCGAANQRTWERLLQALDNPQIADDPRFADNTGRMANRQALEDVLTPIFKAKTSAEWLATFDAVGLPAGPVFDITQMHADPQAVARDMIVEVPHKALGTAKALGMPVKFSGTPAKTDTGAPVYGQHTREVLAEYGYGADAIQALIDAGAVIAAG
ncbi:MAG: CoA transferase [Rhodospirillales bacterium CG15_BIG_FIL_POST_REV_8_21_14_020_66_15]|nr:MAG: CoA transferase [Rhodospirillales bacterium CG15_BIG_FIL_POST_REV_8_21_14_020_66_15]